jgi:hypothetical protein
MMRRLKRPVKEKLLKKPVFVEFWRWALFILNSTE